MHLTPVFPVVRQGSGAVALLAFVLTSGSAAAAPAPALPARAEGPANPGACDALVAYLHGAVAGPVPTLASSHGPWYEERESGLERTLRAIHSQTAPRELAAWVTRACRAAIRRGDAPKTVAAARALIQRREPGWVDRGRVLFCAMQDPASLSDIAAWIDDSDFLSGRARAVRKSTFGWQIDPAVVAAANALGSPELREALVPVLAAANAHHALGYDRLREGVCTDDGAMSGARVQACTTLPAEAEAVWPQSEPARRWMAKGVATAVFAGAVMAAAVEQNQEAGRAIATAAGVPLGATFGLAAGAHDPSRDPTTAGINIRGILGAAVGGTLGGLAAHALAAKPSARVPVTGLALAPLYLGTVITFSVD